MVEGHGTLEAGQLPRDSTTYMSTYTLSHILQVFLTFPNVYGVLGFFEGTYVSKNLNDPARLQSDKRQK